MPSLVPAARRGGGCLQSMSAGDWVSREMPHRPVVAGPRESILRPLESRRGFSSVVCASLFFLGTKATTSRSKAAASLASQGALPGIVWLLLIDRVVGANGRAAIRSIDRQCDWECPRSNKPSSVFAYVPSLPPPPHPLTRHAPRHAKPASQPWPPTSRSAFSTRPKPPPPPPPRLRSPTEVSASCFLYVVWPILSARPPTELRGTRGRIRAALPRLIERSVNSTRSMMRAHRPGAR